MNQIAKAGQGGAEVRILGFAGGTTPDAMQRLALNTLAKTVPLRIAVLTDSRMVRGVITALSWIGNVTVKGFAPGNLAPALAFLNVSGEHVNVFLQAERQLRSKC